MKLSVFLFQLRESEEKAKLLVEERDRLLTERDSALQEAQVWRSKLGKARGNAVILEAVVVRAEEKARCVYNCVERVCIPELSCLEDHLWQFFCLSFRKFLLYPANWYWMDVICADGCVDG